MSDIDLSTGYLQRMLEWGIEERNCQPVLVEALIQEVLRERQRAADAEYNFHKMMSDAEIARAKASGAAAKPVLQDGVRYHTPEQRPMGPDGFPQRGII